MVETKYDVLLETPMGREEHVANDFQVAESGALMIVKPGQAIVFAPGNWNRFSVVERAAAE